MVYETKTPFVLIVEDDRDIAAYFRLVMDLAGYRTEIAENGKLAVEYLYKSPPDIVLLDLSLPGVSGVEVLKILRSDDRLKRTRAVVITGYSQIAEALPVAPDLVLLKPVSPDQLTDLVGRLCQNDKTMEIRPFGKNPWDRTTGFYSRPFFINRMGWALRNGKENRENLFGVLLVSQGKSLRTKPEKKQKELILREIAKLLKASVRPTDTIARFDRDHFFILVENIHSAEFLSMIADRIQTALGNHPAEGIPFSIGAILCDDSYNDIDEILRDVKTAHSLAKKEGQTRCRIFSRDTIKDVNGVPPIKPYQ
jgi:PleD family two-component response regulator